MNTNFNSIKVRLKLRNVGRGGTADEHFNSIKVRLKHFNYLTCHSSDVFQFHKGTIKTGRAGRLPLRTQKISIP